MGPRCGTSVPHPSATCCPRPNPSWCLAPPECSGGAVLLNNTEAAATERAEDAGLKTRVL